MPSITGIPAGSGEGLQDMGRLYMQLVAQQQSKSRQSALPAQELPEPRGILTYTRQEIVEYLTAAASNDNGPLYTGIQDATGFLVDLYV